MRKLSKEVIDQFEVDQETSGTEVALYNLIWTIGSDLFKEWLGVTHVHADHESDHQMDRIERHKGGENTSETA